VQKEAINAIIAGKSPIVAIIPIGRGKSLLFILLAFAKQGSTTVVVVLLIALRSDIK
jgi:superfamily II DNA helicase RecQ